MALIGTIRNNMWIILILVGLALVAFIVMDTTSSINRGYLGPTIIGEIEGEEVDYREFQRAHDLLYTNAAAGEIYTNRESLWKFYIERAIVNRESDRTGLTVSVPELMELQFGQNLSPVIVRRFTNQQTQQFDRTQLDQFKAALDQNQLQPQQRAFWAFQEKEVIQERLKAKLHAIVAKGLYTPTWMAELSSRFQTEAVTFASVRVPFDQYKGDAEVTLADMEEYLQKNKNIYERDEEGRILKYVLFELNPSSQDSAEIKDRLQDLKNDFRAAEDDSAFVATNYGEISDLYFTETRLSPELDTLIHLPIGTVYGPVLVEDYYQLLKVIDKREIPDSVQVRHIVRRVEDPSQGPQALNLIDSLHTLVVENNVPFDSLAREYGQDASASEGGDLGTFPQGRMVPEFNKLVFYEAEEDTVYTLSTQFGFHLVEVTRRVFNDVDTLNHTGVKLARIAEPLIPSETTQSEVYDRAIAFATDNRSVEDMIAAAKGQGMDVHTSEILGENDYSIGELGAGNTSRDVIRWAFDDEVDLGDVSPNAYGFDHPELYYPEKYMIVGLSKIVEPGDPDPADYQDQLYEVVLNRKRAAKIHDRIRDMELTMISETYNLSVDTFEKVTFHSPFIPGLGAEPKVIASVFRQNGDTRVVIGENGVYKLKILEKTEVPASNAQSLRGQITARTRQQVATGLMPALIETAEIRDNRATFF